MGQYKATHRAQYTAQSPSETAGAGLAEAFQAVDQAYPTWKGDEVLSADGRTRGVITPLSGVVTPFSPESSSEEQTVLALAPDGRQQVVVSPDSPYIGSPEGESTHSDDCLDALKPHQLSTEACAGGRFDSEHDRQQSPHKAQVLQSNGGARPRREEKAQASKDAAWMRGFDAACQASCIDKAHGPFKSMESQEELLSDCYCPITLELMADPVVAMDGHSYERSAIELHLQRSTESPLTGEPLLAVDLLPNHALRNTIQALRKQTVDWELQFQQLQQAHLEAEIMQTAVADQADHEQVIMQDRVAVLTEQLEETRHSAINCKDEALDTKSELMQYQAEANRQPQTAQAEAAAAQHELRICQRENQKLHDVLEQQTQLAVETYAVLPIRYLELVQELEEEELDIYKMLSSLIGPTSAPSL